VKKSTLITIGVFIGVIILINLFLDNPTFDNLSDKANFELRANQPELAENTLLQIVLQDCLKVENHYQYISTHFTIPEKKKVGKNEYEYRDDKTIQNFYSSLAQSTDSNIADIGFYGQGLILVNFEKYTYAISNFQQVKNKDLNFLNNSIGNAYNQIDSSDLAELHFRREIEIKGNLGGAYSNLLQLLFDQNRTNELNDYLKNANVKKYFPSRIERAIYFKSFQPIKYGTILLIRVFSGFNIWGAIAALIIMCSWMMFLRKLDIFEIEKWKHVIITMLLGMLFSFLTYPLSDFDNLIFGFKLNGDLINDFFYSVIGIGAIEEFVKIVPLLLMMRFTKAVNEPYDYIKYASLSALGFAFVENLIYFSENNLHIIHGRALTAVVSHMFDSSIIAYGIILNKYKRHKNPYINFIIFFTLASISHGFYDFWLINKSASTFSILTTIFLIVSMYMWNSFKNNALNHSDFYDKEKSIDNEKLQDYLFYSLAGVLLFEYIALAFKYCPSVANNGLLSSIFSGTYLIFFLSVNLSKFSIAKGKWAPIKYWETKENMDYENVVGLKLKLNSFTKNDYAIQFLPNSGIITKRLTVSEEPDWYLIKLDTSNQISSYLTNTVLVRTKEKYEQIEKGKRKFIAFYLIPTETNLEKVNLKRTDFKFCGWATSE
jgi:RsiW-degrading membrane proteinase PrsW (M82 family)